MIVKKLTEEEHPYLKEFIQAAKNICREKGSKYITGKSICLECGYDPKSFTKLCGFTFSEFFLYFQKNHYTPKKNITEQRRLFLRRCIKLCKKIGFKNMNTRQIDRSPKVNSATLYKYFITWDKFIDALINVAIEDNELDIVAQSAFLGNPVALKFFESSYEKGSPQKAFIDLYKSAFHLETLNNL
jgi:hypothetical protein